VENDSTRVCPVELANSLDSRIRRWLQNPQKILAPYVRKGIKVLDVGCGPGFFSIELAKLIGSEGKVISVDLQQGMLNIIENKIKGTELEKRITLVKCDKDKLNVSEKVDFILSFYMVHEVPDKINLFKQLFNILDDKGQYLLVEPKFFHVSGKEFEQTKNLARQIGFEILPGPKLFMSWSAILKKSTK
jgi:ubiquinone/menaquinone biosynthesis C-methylase UbiE